MPSQSSPRVNWMFPALLGHLRTLCPEPDVGGNINQPLSEARSHLFCGGLHGSVSRARWRNRQHPRPGGPRAAPSVSEDHYRPPNTLRSRRDGDKWGQKSPNRRATPFRPATGWGLRTLPHAQDQLPRGWYGQPGSSPNGSPLDTKARARDPPQRSLYEHTPQRPLKVPARICRRTGESR
jgi:hypothetical protein